MFLLVFLFFAVAPTAADQGEVFYPRRVIIDQFPREVKLGGMITFKARLQKGFSSPVLSVTRPDGRTSYLRPRRDQLGPLHRISGDPLRARPAQHAGR